MLCMRVNGEIIRLSTPSTAALKGKFIPLQQPSFPKFKYERKRLYPNHLVNSIHHLIHDIFFYLPWEIRQNFFLTARCFKQFESNSMNSAISARQLTIFHRRLQIVFTMFKGKLLLHFLYKLFIISKENVKEKRFESSTEFKRWFSIN